MIRVCPACQSKNRVPPSRLGQAARCGRCKGALGPLAAPVAVTSVADFDALIHDSPLPVLVDFWAAWCGPCRAVAPELELVADRRAGELVVAKVDTEGLPEVAGRYRIRSIPTLVKFHRGRELERQAGAMPAAEIERRLRLGG